MSRKDVIIVACLLNIALFMVLFATASLWEERIDVVTEPKHQNCIVVQEDSEEEISTPVPVLHTLDKRGPVDEIDEVVQEYTKRRDVLVQQPAQAAPVSPPTKTTPVTKEVVVEVTVKKGDVLSKIAKANDVTVDDIMRQNNLSSSKLKIGQVLKIKKSQLVTSPVIEKNEEPEGAVYYLVKGGDNPWKVARRCNIDYDELLRLNNLDEEKAKNLKVGQKLRIR